VDSITALLSGALEEVRPLTDGAPAGYIPELADVDPEHLALAVVGPRGGVRSVGDDDIAFTIQSMSKPFVLALALAERGRDAVLAKVGPVYGAVGQRWADYLSTLTEEQIAFADELFTRAAEFNHDETMRLRGHADSNG